MKKLLSLTLIIAIVITMSVTAFASEIKENSATNSGSTNITYTVDNSYIVTIPDSMTIGTEATVSVSDVILADGYNLKVSVSSTQYNDGWKLKNNDDYIGYTLKIDGTDVDNNGNVLTARSGETPEKKLVTVLTGTAKYSGRYTDTLTFTVGLIDSNSYNATSVTAEELTAFVTSTLNSGNRNLSIQLSPNADVSMTQAIAKGILNAGVEESSVNLTLKGITKISTNAFYDSDTAKYGYGLKTLNLPDVTTVGNKGLSNCDNLTSVSLPNVTTIEKNAFYDSDNLTSVSLPNATTVGEYAFGNCDNLTSASLPNVTTVGKYAFYYCGKLTSVEIPKVTTIETYTFAYCGSLASVSLPNVTTIESVAFYKCTQLATVSLPNATDIKENAFYNCVTLTTVSLPNVTTLGNYTFSGCTSLTSVNLPKGSIIGQYAFENCPITNLTLSTEGTIFLLGNTFTNSENINLVLNSNKQSNVTDGVTWNGYTFKSITFAN